MSKSNPKGKWPLGRVHQLSIRARDMDVEELADWFDESKICIRQALKYYGVDYKKKFIRRPSNPDKPGPKKQLNAQESIDLFLTQYINQPINQLLTQNWSGT